MKRTEKKVRDEISEVIINRHPKAGKRYIGENFIEVYEYEYKYKNELWIDCYYNNIILVRLIIDSEDIVRRFIVSPDGKGLTQLRWLLEKLKIVREKKTNYEKDRKESER